MSRVYVADVRIQEILNRLNQSGDGSLPCIGLIVGQFSSQKDYVLQLVKSPIVEEKNKSFTTSNDDSSSKKSAAKTLSKSSTSDNLLEKSLCIHARQVRQMLTGGLDILGMFVFTSTDDMKSSANKYKQLLYNMYKVVNKFDFLLPELNRPMERVLLHICSVTKKASCKTYNISDPKHSGNPGEWKFQKITDSFVSLATRFSIRTAIYIQESDMSHCLERQIIDGLQSTIRSVWKSLVLVNGSDLIEDTTCDDDDDKGSSTKKRPIEQFKMADTGCKRARSDEDDYIDGYEDDDDDDDERYKAEDEGIDVKIDLLRNFSKEVDKPLESATVHRCGAKILVHGTLACRAFAHSKTSVTEATKLLKLDIIRSLLTRCELVCQDLLQGEEDQDIRAVYETPVRAFARLDEKTVVQFCDYLFQDETKNDSLDRFVEVLGLQGLKLADIDQSREIIPDAADLEQAETILNRKNSLFRDDLKKTTQTEPSLWSAVFKPLFGVPFSLLVGGLASITASYLYFRSSFNESAGNNAHQANPPPTGR